MNVVDVADDCDNLEFYSSMSQVQAARTLNLLPPHVERPLKYLSSLKYDDSVERSEQHSDQEYPIDFRTTIYHASSSCSSRSSRSSSVYSSEGSLSSDNSYFSPVETYDPEMIMIKTGSVLDLGQSGTILGISSCPNNVVDDGAAGDVGGGHCDVTDADDAASPLNCVDERRRNENCAKCMRMAAMRTTGKVTEAVMSEECLGEKGGIDIKEIEKEEEEEEEEEEPEENNYKDDDTDSDGDSDDDDGGRGGGGGGGGIATEKSLEQSQTVNEQYSDVRGSLMSLAVEYHRWMPTNNFECKTDTNPRNSILLIKNDTISACKNQTDCAETTITLVDHTSSSTGTATTTTLTAGCIISSFALQTTTVDTSLADCCQQQQQQQQPPQSQHSDRLKANRDGNIAAEINNNNSNVSGEENSNKLFTLTHDKDLQQTKVFGIAKCCNVDEEINNRQRNKSPPTATFPFNCSVEIEKGPKESKDDKVNNSNCVKNTNQVTNESDRSVLSRWRSPDEMKYEMRNSVKGARFSTAVPSSTSSAHSVSMAPTSGDHKLSSIPVSHASSRRSLQASASETAMADGGQSSRTTLKRSEPLTSFQGKTISPASFSNTSSSAATVSHIQRAGNSHFPPSINTTTTSAATMSTTRSPTNESAGIVPATISRAASVDVLNVLPPRTRLRRQRRLLYQDSNEDGSTDEDPVERLNRLRARISGVLSEVKGVLKQYSTDNDEGNSDQKTACLTTTPAAALRNKTVLNDDGSVQFRFVKRTIRRSIYSEDDGSNESSAIGLSQSVDDNDYDGAKRREGTRRDVVAEGDSKSLRNWRRQLQYEEQDGAKSIKDDAPFHYNSESSKERMPLDEKKAQKEIAVIDNSKQITDVSNIVPKVLNDQIDTSTNAALPYGRKECQSSVEAKECSKKAKGRQQVKEGEKVDESKAKEQKEVEIKERKEMERDKESKKENKQILNEEAKDVKKKVMEEEREKAKSDKREARESVKKEKKKLKVDPHTKEISQPINNDIKGRQELEGEKIEKNSVVGITKLCVKKKKEKEIDKVDIDEKSKTLTVEKNEKATLENNATKNVQTEVKGDEVICPVKQSIDNTINRSIIEVRRASKSYVENNNLPTILSEKETEKTFEKNENVKEEVPEVNKITKMEIVDMKGRESDGVSRRTRKRQSTPEMKKSIKETNQVVATLKKKSERGRQSEKEQEKEEDSQASKGETIVKESSALLLTVDELMPKQRRSSDSAAILQGVKGKLRNRATEEEPSKGIVMNRGIERRASDIKGDAVKGHDLLDKVMTAPLRKVNKLSEEMQQPALLPRADDDYNNAYSTDGKEDIAAFKDSTSKVKQKCQRSSAQLPTIDDNQLNKKAKIVETSTAKTSISSSSTAISTTTDVVVNKTKPLPTEMNEGSSTASQKAILFNDHSLSTVSIFPPTALAELSSTTAASYCEGGTEGKETINQFAFDGTSSPTAIINCNQNIQSIQRQTLADRLKQVAREDGDRPVVSLQTCDEQKGLPRTPAAAITSTVRDIPTIATTAIIQSEQTLANKSLPSSLKFILEGQEEGFSGEHITSTATIDLPATIDKDDFSEQLSLGEAVIEEAKIAVLNQLEGQATTTTVVVAPSTESREELEDTKDEILNKEPIVSDIVATSTSGLELAVEGMPEQKLAPGPVHAANIADSGADVGTATTKIHKKKILLHKKKPQQQPSSIENAKKAKNEQQQPLEISTNLNSNTDTTMTTMLTGELKIEIAEEAAICDDILKDDEEGSQEVVVKPVKQERKVKKKAIIKRQQRRLSATDTFFANNSNDTMSEPIGNVEVLERVVAYLTDDDDDDDGDVVVGDANNTASGKGGKAGKGKAKQVKWRCYPLELISEEKNKEAAASDKEDEKNDQLMIEEAAPKSCLKKVREYQIGDDILYAERFRKTQIRWKRGTIKERITSISYLLNIGGKDVSAHINYIKKYTGRKVKFEHKEYLEIDYEQLAPEDDEPEENDPAVRKGGSRYNIWNMV